MAYLDSPYIYYFLIVFNSNVWRNSYPLWDANLHNLSDLLHDLSRSFKAIYNDKYGLSSREFLLVFMHIWLIKSAPLRDTYEGLNEHAIHVKITQGRSNCAIGILGIP